MDVEDQEDTVELAPSVFAALVAFLLCAGIVPFFFWLAEQRLIPWAEEVRWLHLRQNPAAPTHEIASTDRIELRRMGCAFLCPIYDVVLFASGRVEYHGINFVCAVGRRITQVDPGTATKLIADFAGSGYFELKWKTGDLAMDASTVHTRLTVGARSRGIENYHGDGGVPRVLGDMERAIDEIAGTAPWIPKHDRQGRYCLTADGRRFPPVDDFRIPPEQIAPH